jgi:hypothetical protein
MCKHRSLTHLSALIVITDLLSHLFQSISGGNRTKTERRLPVRLHGQFPPSRSSNPHSLDTEGLFDLEGMEEMPTESCQSEEESDTDGRFLQCRQAFL